MMIMYIPPLLTATDIDSYTFWYTSRFPDLKELVEHISDAVTFEARMYSMSKTLNHARPWRNIGQERWYAMQKSTTNPAFFCGGQSN